MVPIGFVADATAMRVASPLAADTGSPVVGDAASWMQLQQQQQLQQLLGQQQQQQQQHEERLRRMQQLQVRSPATAVCHSRRNLLLLLAVTTGSLLGFRSCWKNVSLID
jgi:hypothetical protein